MRRRRSSFPADRDAVPIRVRPGTTKKGKCGMTVGLRTMISSLAVLLFAAGPAAAQGVLVDRSDIRFVAKQMGVNVEGRFRKWTANVAFLPKDVAKSRAEFDIDLASIDLASEDSEKEVKGRMWFDAVKFPVAHFASTSVRDLGGDKYEIAGALSLKGIKRDVVVPIALRKDDAGNGVAEGSFTLKRLDFNIGEGLWSDTETVPTRSSSGSASCCPRQNEPGIIPGRRCSPAGAVRPPLHSNINQSGEGTVHIRMVLAGFVAACAASVAAQETYELDPVHSQPQYETRHIGMRIQHGNFGKMTGKVTLDRAAKKGSMDLTIDATSIRSNDPRLDAILKGERFFNVEKFPTLTFKSSSVAFDGDRVVGVDGELTMLGVTKPVSFKVANFSCGESPFSKKAMCGADATATIKRSEWGMTNGLQISNPADDIKLIVPIEAYRE